MRNSRIWMLFTMLLAFSAGSGAAAGSAEVERPNLIFLLTDDQRWDTLGTIGNAVIETPNLDRLAAEGVLFRNAFVTTSVCAVSRASILSGQYAHRHRIRDFITAFSSRALSETYPLLLRASGYDTGFIGKWGIGARQIESLDAVSEQFDFWAGFSGQGNYWHGASCRWVTHGITDPPSSTLCDCPLDHRGRAGPQGRVGKKDIENPRHLTADLIPEKVAQYLDAWDPTRPFALSISFKAPHGPRQDWDSRMSALYNDVEIPLSPTATAAVASRTAEFLAQSLESDRGQAIVRNPEEFQVHLRNYYRLITGVDSAIGRIRKTLADRRLEHNTVILFTSDNGLLMGEHGLFGKWLMYEESIRVPLILYDPRLPVSRRGSIRDQTVLNIDVAPTLLELAGLPIPKRMQGKSMVPLLTRPELELRDSWFYEHHFQPPGVRHIEPSEGVRTRRLKYIRYIDQDPPHEELYDLVNDSGETRNLAPHPDYQDALAELRRQHRRFHDGRKDPQ